MKPEESLLFRDSLLWAQKNHTTLTDTEKHVFEECGNRARRMAFLGFAVGGGVSYGLISALQRMTKAPFSKIFRVSMSVAGASYAAFTGASSAGGHCLEDLVKTRDSPIADHARALILSRQDAEPVLRRYVSMFPMDSGMLSNGMSQFPDLLQPQQQQDTAMTNDITQSPEAGLLLNPPRSSSSARSQPPQPTPSYQRQQQKQQQESEQYLEQDQSQQQSTNAYGRPPRQRPSQWASARESSDFNTNIEGGGGGATLRGTGGGGGGDRDRARDWGDSRPQPPPQQQLTQQPPKKAPGKRYNAWGDEIED